MNDTFWQIIAIVGLVLLATIILLQMRALSNRSQSNRKSGEQSSSIYSSDESLDAFNTLIDARDLLVEVVNVPEDTAKSEEELFDRLAACCAANSAKVQTTILPRVHPLISSTATEYITLYSDFCTIMSDWKVNQQRFSKARIDNGVFDYMFKFALDLTSGDPLRQNRELEKTFIDISEDYTQLKHQTNALWARFHALNEMLYKRAPRLGEEFGWTFKTEDENNNETA